MTQSTCALTFFPPTRAEAETRLGAFLPAAGRDYATRRNYDTGPGQPATVSRLSPYLRHRILTETEVLGPVLRLHGPDAAEKFVQEVFWRTYWKGWLEMRPGVWGAYQRDLRRRLDEVQTQSGLRRMWEDACTGQTGIDGFDHWARQLVGEGYLHNHARMWFASIWIFTLKLPWELGADFFLRHLLDGDPASNTLSWRWVAGLQTQGKTYLARADNIEKFTQGRFRPTGLAKDAPALDGPPSPERQPVPPAVTFDPARRTGLLLHGDDLSPGFALNGQPPAACAVLRAEDRLSPLRLAPHVPDFLDGALNDALARHDLSPDLTTTQTSQIADWARAQGLEQIVTPYAPVGPVAAALDELSACSPVPLVRVRRDYDSAAWPHATHGFFRFKKHIPDLIDRLGLQDPA
ncbi:DNA photolyase [Aliishimia ponticola]|uniref:DNA photolyase n=1 Tax=Aliishimia ponticola TaxID=2499833 RepID=A0A4S4NET9_9RHOB|nr:FAD-binding domain-containing protein [Aliishimia ponticola]THH38062.1 DNA photolyase [Aliishimia ponticola]